MINQVFAKEDVFWCGNGVWLIRSTTELVPKGDPIRRQCQTMCFD